MERSSNFAGTLDSQHPSLSLRLYVSGQALNSRAAIRNLEQLRALLDDNASVEIIDVREKPELADEDRIIATPTLVRRQPTPVRKIIGDLSDTERVLLGLEIAKADAV